MGARIKKKKKETLRFSQSQRIFFMTLELREALKEPIREF